MNACVLKINVNGLWLTLDENFSPEEAPTLKVLVDKLAVRKDWRSKIEKDSKRKIAIKVTEEDLVLGMVPNTTIGNILEDKNIVIDKIDLSTPVLAVKRLIVNGINYYGKRVVVSDDNGKPKEIYVIDVNNENLLRGLIKILQYKYKLEHPEEFPIIHLLEEKFNELFPNGLQSLNSELTENSKILAKEQEIVEKYNEAVDAYNSYKEENKELSKNYNEKLKVFKNLKELYDLAHSIEFEKYKKAKKELNSLKNIKTEEAKKSRETYNTIIKNYEKNREDDVKKSITDFDDLKTKYFEYIKTLQSKKASEEVQSNYEKLLLIKAKTPVDFNLSFTELLADFVVNRSNYVDYKINGMNLEEILSKILSLIMKLTLSKNKYNSISNLLEPAVIKISKKPYINIQKLKSSIEDILGYLHNLKELSEELSKLMELCNEAVDKDYFTIKNKSKKLSLEEYSKYLLEKSEALKGLLTNIFESTENDLFVEVIDGDNIFNDKHTLIFLKPKYTTLELRYGWNFETIRGFTKILKGESDLDFLEYGYNIYRGIESSGKNFFVYSPDVITPYSYGQKYSSIEEILEKIKGDLTYVPFYELAKIGILRNEEEDFKNCLIPKRYAKGLIVRSLDYSFDSEQFNKLKTSPLTNFIYKYFTDSIFTYTKIIDDLKTLLSLLGTPINDLPLLTKFISPQHLAIFLYLLGNTINENGKFDYNIFKDVFDKFDPNKYTYLLYYVDNSFQAHKKDYVKVLYGEYFYQKCYQTTLCKMDSCVLEDLTKFNESLERLPSFPVLLKFTNLLNKKLNVLSELLTSDLISDRFGKNYSYEKAFIKDGIVYINVSLASLLDGFHEYTHLLLGSLKAMNYLHYVKLLEAIANTPLGINMINKLSYKYPDLAQMDLFEEAFAELYALYILANNNGNLEETLKSFAEGILGKNLRDEKLVSDSLEKLQKALEKLNNLSGNDPKTEKLRNNLQESIAGLKATIAEKLWRLAIFSKGEDVVFGNILTGKLNTILSRFSRDFGDYMTSLSEFKIPEEAMLYRRISNVIKDMIQQYKAILKENEEIAIRNEALTNASGEDALEEVKLEKLRLDEGIKEVCDEKL